MLCGVSRPASLEYKDEYEKSNCNDLCRNRGTSSHYHQFVSRWQREKLKNCVVQYLARLENTCRRRDLRCVTPARGQWLGHVSSITSRSRMPRATKMPSRKPEISSTTIGKHSNYNQYSNLTIHISISTQKWENIATLDLNRPVLKLDACESIKTTQSLNMLRK